MSAPGLHRWSIIESVEWISTAMVSHTCVLFPRVGVTTNEVPCCCCVQLLHVRDTLVTDDYTSVLTALMRYPKVDDPYMFFQVSVCMHRTVMLMS